jgi:SpoVK/Ycf46/Vps4 family AAA+-type ATPase
MEQPVATGELLTELVRAHYNDEPSRFGTILGQVIAAESRAGHTQVARRLRELRITSEERPTQKAVPIARASKSLSDVVDITYSNVALADLILPANVMSRIERVVIEQRQTSLLEENGLHPRRKLLLHGPPGTGKTLTAAALAGELKLPLARVRLEVLFSRYLGETASTLTDIFSEATRVTGVYLFDEFDALGSPRGDSSDVGEMRRIVGTFLQLLDSDTSGSIFIAATNIRANIDNALFRRFDDVIEYGGPSQESRLRLIKRHLGPKALTNAEFNLLATHADQSSLADLTAAINDAKKTALLSGEQHVTFDVVSDAIKDRSNR